MLQRRDRRELRRLEDAVVVIALDRAERFDHLAMAGAEADAPAGHVVAFAHRREFDADFLGAGRGEKTRRLIAVEADVGVREVGDHEEAEPLGERDEFDVEVLIDRGARRIVRKVDDDELRLRMHHLAGAGEVLQVRLGIGDVEFQDARRRQRRCMNVDRKRRSGGDADVARSQERKTEVRETFLGSDRGDDFAVGIERDAVPPFVLCRRFTTKFEDRPTRPNSDASRDRAPLPAAVRRCASRRASVGLPMPRSMTSIPAFRFLSRSSLILPNR